MDYKYSGFSKGGGMVLAYSLTPKAVISILILFSLSTIIGGKQVTPVAWKVQVRGYTFKLKEQDGKCILNYSGHRHQGELSLMIPSPCEIMRDNKGGPSFITYKDIGNTTVLLIVGGPTDSSRTDSWMKEGCGKSVQAILVRNNVVTVSAEIYNQGPIICPSDLLDEPYYWLLSHSKRHKE
jgi:hypothetical protein